MRLMTTAAWTVLALAIASPALAETLAATADSGEVDALIVTGTRRADRTVFDSAAPVDVVSAGALDTVASANIMDKLVSNVPSFNAQRLPTSDGQQFVRPATLRGLSADQTLVLVNGKRRHRSAFLGTRGAQAPDLTQIPNFAISRIEVLRDGASAQYGSDAIAGVINIILDEKPGVAAFSQVSQYYAGDGLTVQGGVRAGMELGQGGHLVGTLSYTDSEETSRTRQRADAIAFQAANPTLNVPNPVQKWGQPDWTLYRLAVDAALPLSDNFELYGFATYTNSTGDNDFNWRNPSTDTSYKLAPAVFPGWDLRSVYPTGFSPRFGQDEVDYQVNGGLRGTAAGFHWDVSAGFGRDEIKYFLNNSINASFGPQSPRSFKPGTLIQEENNLNLDVTRELAFGWLASPANLAFGAERREEQYEIKAGDRYSWDVGPGAAAGLPSGSNGFPGYSPSQAGSWKQTSYAAYADLDLPITDAFTADVAVRYEDSSEFSDSTNGKLALRYAITPDFAIRGTVSTGFRAPTPGQVNSTRTSQGLDTNTLLLFTSGRLSPLNPVSVFFGATPLTPEKSRNASLGLTWRNSWGFNGSIDVYQVEVDDRLAQSQNFTVTSAIRAQLLALGVPGADSLTSVSFFTNAFDTRTRGVDVVGSWNGQALGGKISLTGAYNYNDTKVIRSNLTTVSALAKVNIEDALPEHTGNVSATYSRGRFEGMVRVRYFGEWTDAQFQNSANLIQTFGARTLVDLALTATVNDKVKVTVGAENLFDTYPDEATFQASRGLVYSRNAAYDTDGGLYYARINVQF